MIRRILTFSAALLLSACAGEHQNNGPSPQNTVPGTSAQPVQAVQTQPPAQQTGTLRYAFVDRFNKGHINLNTPVSTPTGKGALILEWPFGTRKIKAITVIATYRYSYAAIPIAAKDMLTFEAAKPLAVGGPVKAVVDVTDAGRTSRIFEQTLPPATARGLDWKPFAVDLKQFVGHQITVTFGTEDAPGGGIGAWVAFAQPAIISMAK